MGYGYFDTANSVKSYEDLNDCVSHYQDNRDVQQIIRSYLRRNRVEKIIKF
jgi:DNA polymerase III subunit epsilon